MAQKFWGSINLNAIKEAIDGGVKPFEGKKGKYLDVNIWVNDEDDQFGNRCSVSVYNKETKSATYLGNFKLSEYDDAPKKAESSEPKADLPF